ncbi:MULTISPECIES: DegT/DnrJ/EryC1/StrS aminotransferase family protein [unclassified Marinobacterium]|uniref:DegT/DnrJ/EryC1/StrS family aminotransferase n=1 Tax=unclassified Marinobacterium TaxID=2644139 RepID=UPI0015687E9C|nr:MULTISPECIES: DegT/DnrJ/EryC1/StrS family aminotransferase [unclassified Marinobacterium]NRP53627.1 dTDP-4-amino-4,6-dideoxy-D-glucose transaminase [Marinobacterium sp. xm-v-242]NRP77877.1 dTDP-4-amino-4,6-dideoxy-D-glucose transaminase [Marinobacterium sp. xm-m-383]
MIPVIKPYLPSRKKVDAYIDSIYETNWLTNNGPLVQKLTQRLADYLCLDSRCLVLVANGSLALHLAYKALEIRGEVITTPFTFIATASTLKWEGLEPVFSDIDKETWNIDPNLVEDKITPNTSAIVPVHVFGNPCDVAAIQTIANKHKLKVVYDASHCFGTTLNCESVLKHGDASTISFHATKLFHTVEGGAVITKTPELAEKIRKMINFGILQDGSIGIQGTNAKMSEFHAAVGLAVLDEIENIQSERKDIWEGYREKLGQRYQLQRRHPLSNNNYAYFPLVMESEDAVINMIGELAARGIQSRRYFNPSLDTVELYELNNDCSISRNISSRILCIPSWQYLESDIREVLCGVLV